MIKIEIDHWSLAEIAKKNPENYELLREAEPELPPVEKMAAGEGYQSFEAFVNEPEQLPDFIFEKARFSPVRPMKLLVDGRVSAIGLKEAMAAAQVHLPGNELLRIHQVKVEEDCCTDKLQELLDQGWRIVAVCPQPSRRPDYVLGRL